MVQGSNPGGGKISTSFQTSLGANPASCIMGMGSFSGVKQLGHDVDHPPHLVPRLKKE